MVSAWVAALVVAGGGAGTWFDDFRTYEEVDAYLDTLAEENADAEVLDVGTSIEGRAIRGLRIGRVEGQPTILVTGTQHAREWISPMVTACIADHLVRDDGVDPQITAALDRLEIIVIPVVNPDGYVFSWEVDRFWRKNRRPGGGVDLNRNWPTMWGVGTAGAGPGDEIYPGTGPLSEPESAAVAALAEARDVVAFVDYHSPVNLVLIPFAFTAEPGPHEATQQQWAGAMASSITAVHGVTHTVSKPGMGNPSGGLAQDWFADDRDAISFTVELRSGGGGSGFILPAAQIVDACEENWAGFVELATRTSDAFGVDPPAGGSTGGTMPTTTTAPGGDGASGADGSTNGTPNADDGDDAGTTTGRVDSDGTDADTVGAAPQSDEASGCQCRSDPRRPTPWLWMLCGFAAARRSRPARR